MRTLAILYFLVLIAIVVGWCMNLVHVIGSLSGEFTTELVVRLVGIPVFPLGVICGWFA